MSPSSRQNKRGTRKGQTLAHKQPQVVHGQPGASTGERQLTNQADQAPQDGHDKEHAGRSTGEHPERSGREAGHGSGHYESVEKQLARSLKNAFKNAGHQAELKTLVGERDARRADLRVCIKGRQQFINIRVIKLVDERDRSRQDPTGQGFLPAYPNASPLEVLQRTRAALDQRFIEVENEMRQQYSDVKNFSPFVISERGAMGLEAERQWRYWSKHVRSIDSVSQKLSVDLLRARTSSQQM